MPFPNVTFDQFLDTLTRDELQHLCAQIEGYLRREHKDDGSHASITADALTVNGDATITGDLTAEGDTHTLGEFVFRSGPSVTLESMTVGGTTNGWRVARGSTSSPLAAGFSWRLYDLARDVSTPLHETGYYSVGDYYALVPRAPGGKAFALGLNTSSAERIKLLAVQDGVYEQGRSFYLGQRQTLAYSDNNFIGNVGGSADWVVDDADELVMYTRIGDMVIMDFTVSTSTVANSPTQLLIVHALTSTPNMQSEARCRVVNGGAAFDARVVQPSNSNSIIIARDNGAAFTNETNLTTVAGQIVFWTA